MRTKEGIEIVSYKEMKLLPPLDYHWNNSNPGGSSGVSIYLFIYLFKAIILLLLLLGLDRKQGGVKYYEDNTPIHIEMTIAS